METEFIHYADLTVKERICYDYEGRIGSEDDEQFIVLREVWGTE